MRNNPFQRKVKSLQIPKRSVFFRACVSVFLLGSLSLVSFCFVGCDKKKVNENAFRLPPGTKPETVMEKAEKFARKHQYKEAVEQFLAVRNNFPGSDWATKAHLRAAETYLAWKQYQDAATSFAEFRKLHPLHPKADYAHFKQGEALFKEAPKAIDRDQTACLQTVSILQAFISKYPTSEFNPQAKEIYQTCRKRLAGKEFFIGRFYYRRKEYKAAAIRLRGAIDDFATEGYYAEPSHYYLGLTLLKMGDRANAQTVFKDLIEKFPASRYSAKAKKRVNL